MCVVLISGISLSHTRTHTQTQFYNSSRILMSLVTKLSGLQQLSSASSNTFIIDHGLKKRKTPNECEQRHSGGATQCKLLHDEVANPTASLIDT